VGVVNFNHTYPFLIPLTALCAGILCAGSIALPEGSLYAATLLFLLCICCKPLHRICGLWLITALFIYGAEKSAPPHFAPSPTTVYCLKFRCEELLPQGALLNCRGHRFYLPGHQPDSSLQTGDSLSVTGRIFPIGRTGNEGSFNYNQYLRRKKAYYRLAPAEAPEKGGRSENLLTFFEKLRHYMRDKTERLLPEPTHNALLKALCLGYKNDLDNPTRELFTETGTVHLLAVSGLHTGAVFLLLSFFFRLAGLNSAGSQCLILPLLWGYALLTGLSPSVIRAASILTFIVIGKAFSQQYSSLNAVAASAFLTLLLDPLSLYSVSMQMSYAAYTGIVLFYPLFLSAGKKLPVFLRGGYSLLGVTLAAQMATLPLSAYYFHTLNINSFLFNLPAVPLSTLLLYISVVALCLPFFIGRYLIILSDLLCRLLLGMLQLFRGISFNLHDVCPTPLHVAFIYLLLLLLSGLAGAQKRFCLHCLCLTLLLFTGYCCLHNHRISSGDSLIVFHAYRQSHILIRCNGYYHLPFSENNTPSYHTAGYIRQYRLKPMPATGGFSDGECVFTGRRWKTPQQHIALLTPAGSDPGEARTWVVTGNLLPRQLPASEMMLPEKIILDGSNGSFSRREWEKFCRDRRIRLLKTEEQGSISLQ
jgi:competence protein ComEC